MKIYMFFAIILSYGNPRESCGTLTGVHGRTGRGGGGVVAPPDCWANMASRAIFV